MHWTPQEVADIQRLYHLFIRMAFHTAYHPELAVCHGPQES